MAGKTKIIMLMGPTATGKTGIAIDAAEQFNGEIISVDSALVYRDMNIGTAKPTQDELARIPHHLIDIIEPEQTYSVAQFRRQALNLIDDITSRGKLPILAGGTVLYHRALLNGLAPMPTADPEIRQRLTQCLMQQGAQVLHQRLQDIDPVSAQRIHSNDPQRLLRALEVYEISGKTLTQHHRQPQQCEAPFECLKLGLIPDNRQQHRELIAERFHSMLKSGFVEEVQALRRRKGLSSDSPSMRSIGYRQIWLYLDGHYDFKTMTGNAVTATRQLAKRQMTWLRKEPDIRLLNCFQSPKMPLLRHISQFLD